MIESKAGAIIVGRPDHDKVVFASLTTGRGGKAGSFNTQRYAMETRGKSPRCLDEVDWEQAPTVARSGIVR